MSRPGSFHSCQQHCQTWTALWPETNNIALFINAHWRKIIPLLCESLDLEFFNRHNFFSLCLCFFVLIGQAKLVAPDNFCSELVFLLFSWRWKSIPERNIFVLALHNWSFYVNLIIFQTLIIRFFTSSRMQMCQNQKCSQFSVPLLTQYLMSFHVVFCSQN